MGNQRPPLLRRVEKEIMASLFRLATQDVDLVKEMRECIGRLPWKELDLERIREDSEFSWFRLPVAGAISESSGGSKAKLAIEDTPRDDQDENMEDRDTPRDKDRPSTPINEVDNTEGDDTPRRESRGGNAGGTFGDSDEENMDVDGAPRVNTDKQSSPVNDDNNTEGDDTPRRESRGGNAGGTSGDSDEENSDEENLVVDGSPLGNRLGKLRRPRAQEFNEEEGQDMGKEDRPRYPRLLDQESKKALRSHGSEKTHGKRKNPSPAYVTSRKKSKGGRGVQNQTLGSSIDVPIDVDNPFVRIIAPPSSSCL
jgi:hypothetical protein